VKKKSGSASLCPDKHKAKADKGCFLTYDSRGEEPKLKTKKVNHSFARFGAGMVFLLATLYINPNNVIH